MLAQIAHQNAEPEIVRPHRRLDQVQKFFVFLARVLKFLLPQQNVGVIDSGAELPADGRGFEPLVPCGTHAFQACTIDRSVTHPLDRQSKLQPAKQFVERQLNADEKFAEVGVFGAHRIKAHLINNGFDLKGVAREKRHTPLGVIEAG